MTRRVSVVKTFLAILTAIVAGLFYWFALRPLPQRSGTIDANLSAPASAAFDALGVPHIRAANLDDALFVQGYVTAQDRLWQMDGLRRYSAGELAEIVGPAGLDADRESRRLRARKIAEQSLATLPAADRAAMEAYARGVNAFINTHLHQLPLEFTILNYQPRPWRVIDSLLVCIYMFRDLTTTWRDEIVKLNMLADGDATKVQQLFPVRAGDEGQPGSNAWAIAGSHTASGKPILSNDMHLAYSLPGIWHMTHMQAPGMDVSGVALPGVPGIIVGHNQRIAWGITNLQFDVQDLYIEKFDPRQSNYSYRGQMEPVAAEREVILVKGQPAVDLPITMTQHGPLFVTEGNDQMALRWAAALPGLLQFPFLDIDRAQNWDQFLGALARFPGPGSNFIYADVDGNIGYHAAGKLPKRRGYAGDLPVDGASGEFDWDGMIPFEELPTVFNPASGIIASANQNPFPANYPYPVNGNFAPPHRFRQIRNLLSSRNGWRPEETLKVQMDLYSGLMSSLAGQVAAAYRNRGANDPVQQTAIDILQGWNGQMQKDLPAPFLISLVYFRVRAALAESAAPGKGLAYEYNLAPVVVEKMLRERPPGWFPNYDDMLLRALSDAVAEGRRMQGEDMRRWQYGEYLRIGINHPVTHQVPLFGRFFDILPVPMSGSTTTVKQTTTKLSASMRMNTDLSNWDHSLLNVIAGQSGQILSSHYRDQWEAYYSGRSYPMQYDKVEQKSRLEFRPTLPAP